MRVRFLLGPAGSGKTFRCLAEIRAVLADAAEGAPLVLLAPKQATFQLERQLLADVALPGYTRLRVVSFDRLADFVLVSLRRPPPRLVSEEGRVMVLRALLSRHRERLRQFRASARLPGFASELSDLLREFQRFHLTPAALERLASAIDPGCALAHKLVDLSLLFGAYRDWLRAEGLQDADYLLDVATATLCEGPFPEPTYLDRQGPRGAVHRVADGSVPPLSVQGCAAGPTAEGAQAKACGYGMGAGPRRSADFRLAGLWLDGFAEMTPQEIELLAVLVPHAETATLAFCLERIPEETEPPLSPWATVGRTFRRCRERLETEPGIECAIEILARRPDEGRFAGSRVLQHLEAACANWRARGSDAPGGLDPSTAVRVAACANPEAEATFAAREILRFVREEGGRFREVAVLLRTLDGYHEVLRRVFARYQIPFFLDRREPIAHHPLAELTRSAVRIVAFGWRHDDWFGALKTGLVHPDEAELDWLENEALARGWHGEVWLQPVAGAGDPATLRRLERLRRTLAPAFERFTAHLAAHAGRPTGTQLAEALAGLWEALEAARTLESWSAPGAAEAGLTPGDPIHLTVWEQMQDWLENLALAFPAESLPVTEWLPILEAGLGALTVGVIPPVLDQVLIGTIDRSRNPDLQMALVMGVNESVFPAAPALNPLLTDLEREQLADRNVALAPWSREALGRERYYGYIAWTRARRELRVTFSQRDAEERPVNPSSFITHLQRLCPALQIEAVPGRRPWWESEHAGELVAPWLAGELPGDDAGELASALEAWPGLGEWRERLARFTASGAVETLESAVVDRLYGTRLETSVSRLEQFAACPFRFFVHSGLRAQERLRFELDARERGSFQHEVLAEFHRQLTAEQKRWRDLAPGDARERIGRIGAALAGTFREGLLRAEAGSRFAAGSLTSALEDFVEALVGWMPQYGFDPVAVELSFGARDDSLPAWELDLGNGRRLALRGKIDRVDLARGDVPGHAFCVVIDYKSGRRQLDPALLAGGVQLQLPAYLAVLRRLGDPQLAFGVGRLVPAGVFYVSLRGHYAAVATRSDAVEDAAAARRNAYQHTGRFDFERLRQLDRRREAKTGDQFKYHLKKDGLPYASDRDPMSSEAFAAFLEAVEAQLIRLGREIFSGTVEVDPYRRGRQKACDDCDYASICRIDPWTHGYRALSAPAEARADA